MRLSAGEDYRRTLAAPSATISSSYEEKIWQESCTLDALMIDITRSGHVFDNWNLVDMTVLIEDLQEVLKAASRVSSKILGWS